MGAAPCIGHKIVQARALPRACAGCAIAVGQHPLGVLHGTK